jgi:glucose/arabinose dehydrogenase
MTPGAHAIELATVVQEPSGAVESDRSAPLRVVLTGGVGANGSPPTRITTRDGLQLALARLAGDLNLPTDIAFAEDGTVFVAERGGRIRRLRPSTAVFETALDLSESVSPPNGGLLAIALDLKYAETGFLYALSANAAPDNGLELMLARFRGVEHEFGDRAVLFDRIPASSSGARGALRTGRDNTLFVAIDGTDDDRQPANLGSYNGKVLRFNVDATTPNDQSNPIYSADHPSPVAIDWQPGNGALWVVETAGGSAGRLTIARPPLEGARSRFEHRTTYTLPEGTGPSSAVFYRSDRIPAFQGNLFIAAEGARELIRLRFTAGFGRVPSAERLLTDQIGPIRVVGEGRDGALYLATDTSLFRLGSLP